MLQWPHAFSHHHTLPVFSLLNNIFSDAKRTWLYRKVKKKFAKRPNLPFSLQIFVYGNGLFMHRAYFGLASSLDPTLTLSTVFPPRVFFVTELNSKTDLQSLSGKTLSATSGSSSPGPVPATSTLLCPYVNLLLCNAQPSGEEHFGHFFFFFFGEVICFDLQRVPDFQKYQIRTGLLESLPCLWFSFHSSAFQ